MALTDAQLVTFKADLDANTDPAITQAITDGTNNVIAGWYNDDKTGYYVWRTNITTAEVKDVVDWTEFIGRSSGERGAFMLLIEDGIVNAGKTNVRQGFADIFSGPNGATTRNALTTLAKRLGSNIEAVLVSSGTGTENDPGSLTFEGAINRLDVAAALKL